MTSVQLGVLFHVGNFSTILAELYQQLFTDVGVCHFTAAEADSDLDTVAFLQELLGILQFDVEIVGSMLGDIRTSLISTTRWFFLASFSFFSCSKRNLP